ncbi:nitroreductase family protein [Miniphocaeibacter massiliensis]|uniref:nitroreductase family protein n=1 Tax=Miniphocaeibacter massiliensis TaxID=2041841 RepID=UPI000C081FFC|nr:nitroreductase family protein [Miniphocaeibacter massiliensis]
MDFIGTITTEGRKTLINLPFNAKEKFNQPKGSIKVYGKINGQDYKGKLISKDKNTQFLRITKEFQEALGYSGEDLEVKVSMYLDEVPNFEIEIVPNNKYIEDIKYLITRKSEREYLNKKVDRELIEAIIYAGMSAPTARNRRPVHFILLDNENILKELAANNRNARMLAKSKYAIVVCGDNSIEKKKGHLIEDCSAATQNILSAIHTFGLGGVWCEVQSNIEWRNKITEILDIPSKITPISLVVFGHVKNINNKNKKVFTKGKIHNNKW